MTRSFKISIAAVVVGGGLAYGLLLHPLTRNICINTYSSRVREDLLEIAAGCRAYHMEYNVWPDSLGQLDVSNNVRNLPFFESRHPGRDEWGNPYVYQSYDPAKGYGTIMSYGSDGRPGGRGDAADLVIHFTVNRQTFASW